MSNLGGLEILTIMIIALVVLGPTKLPDAARQVGRVVNELRKISGGFQREMRDAMNETLEADARARGAQHAPPTATPASLEPATDSEPATDAERVADDAVRIGDDPHPPSTGVDAEPTEPAAERDD